MGLLEESVKDQICMGNNFIELLHLNRFKSLPSLQRVVKGLPTPSIRIAIWS
jgi:hypothetical protein